MQLDIKRYHTLKPQRCLLCNDEVVYHSNKELQRYQRQVHQGILEQRCPIGWQRGVFITNEAVYVPRKSPSTADDFYTLPRPSPPYTPERWWWAETSCRGWWSHGKYFPLMPDWWMCRSDCHSNGSLRHIWKRDMRSLRRRRTSVFLFLTRRKKIKKNNDRFRSSLYGLLWFVVCGLWFYWKTIPLSFFVFWEHEVHWVKRNLMCWGHRYSPLSTTLSTFTTTSSLASYSTLIHACVITTLFLFLLLSTLAFGLSVLSIRHKWPPMGALSPWHGPFSCHTSKQYY